MTWKPTIVGQTEPKPHDGSGTEPEELAPEPDWLKMPEAPDEEANPDAHWRWRFAHASQNITELLNGLQIEEAAQVSLGLAHEYAARAKPSMQELGWSLTFPLGHPLVETSPMQSLSEVRLFTTLAQACAATHHSLVKELHAKSGSRIVTPEGAGFQGPPIIR